jgi:hypothetical protein
MLAPHHRENPELGHVRRAPEDRDDALELLGSQPVLGGELRRDVAPAVQEPQSASPSPPAGREERVGVRGAGTATGLFLTNVRLAPPSPLLPQAGGEEKISRKCWGEISAKSVMIYCKALTSPSKKAWPSVRPSSGSLAFSGCGIRPRMVRVSLKMPAIARAEPLKLAPSLLSPLAPQ